MIYCKFYDNKQSFISGSECSLAVVPIPQNAVCGLFYDDTYKITQLDIEYDNVNQTFNSAVTDHYLVIFPASQTSLYASDVRSSQLMSTVPNLTQTEKDYLKNLASGSVDFSTIVTALDSIAAALSALTNLSNLSNLSQLVNIITAINNKDNQSSIVSELDKIFINKYDNVEYSFLKPDNNILSSITSDFRGRYTLSGVLTRMMSLITSNRRNLDQYFSDFNTSTFRTNNLPLFESSSKTSFQNLQDISLKLNGIETKLEQNLPFTTVVENDIVETNIVQNCSYGSKIEQIPFSE